MTKKSKLEQFGLLEEAKSLKDSGKGFYEIANVLNDRQDDVKLSHMSIKRGLDSLEKKELKMEMDKYEDPFEALDRKFTQAVNDNTKKLDKLVNIADTILNEAMADGTIADKTRALKEVRDSLAQVVKNWTALKQYGIRQASNTGDIVYRKEQDIKVLIINWAEDLYKLKTNLCDSCKKELDSWLKNKLEMFNK